MKPIEKSNKYFKLSVVEKNLKASRAYRWAQRLNDTRIIPLNVRSNKGVF